MQLQSLSNNPQARLLARLMRDFSEEYWFVVWFHGTEYSLWADLTGQIVCGKSGWNISTSEKEELQVAHDLANGWIVSSYEFGGLAFVTTDDWLQHLASEMSGDVPAIALNSMPSAS